MNRLSVLAKFCSNRGCLYNEKAWMMANLEHRSQEEVAFMCIKANAYMGMSVAYLKILRAIRYQRNVVH